MTVTAGDDAGGLVGESYSHRATINRSSADSTVTGESAGGLVGTATNITITNSYAHGSATGDDAAGLVAAAWFSTITNSYATTAITGTRDTGGLVADGDLNTITNSYWDSTTTGHASSLGSPDTAAKTTTELQQDTETGQCHRGRWCGHRHRLKPTAPPPSPSPPRTAMTRSPPGSP